MTNIELRTIQVDLQLRAASTLSEEKKKTNMVEENERTNIRSIALGVLAGTGSRFCIFVVLGVSSCT